MDEDKVWEGEGEYFDAESFQFGNASMLKQILPHWDGEPINNPTMREAMNLFGLKKKFILYHIKNRNIRTIETERPRRLYLGDVIRAYMKLREGPERQRQAWTEETLDLLRDTNLTDKELGERLGRSELAIKHKRHRLGILKAQKWDGWTRAEIEVLKSPVSHSVAAKIVRRTMRGVQDHRDLLVAAGKTERLPGWSDAYRPYTEKELFELFGGATVEELVESLGRSRKSVLDKRSLVRRRARELGILPER